jgi:AcrR family transcriptional regulator
MTDPAATRRSRPRLTQAERNEDAKRRLIEACIAGLNVSGFAGVTTQGVARRAGLTTGALHHHFATKTDLLIAVLDFVSARILKRLQGSGGPEDVATVIDGLWEVYGGADYWATWEIIIGFRFDRETSERLTGHRLKTMETLAHPWLVRYAARAEDRRRVMELFEFILIVIRGLRLEKFLRRDEEYFRRNLAMLGELVSERLARLLAERG